MSTHYLRVESVLVAPSASCTQGMVTTEWELLKRKQLVRQGMERVPNDVVGQSPLPPSQCRWTAKMLVRFSASVIEYFNFI